MRNNPVLRKILVSVGLVALGIGAALLGSISSLLGLILIAVGTIMVGIALPTGTPTVTRMRVDTDQLTSLIVDILENDIEVDTMNGKVQVNAGMQHAIRTKIQSYLNR